MVGFSGESPASEGEGGVGGDDGDVDVGEEENAHGLAVRVGGLEALEGGVEAQKNVAAGGEPHRIGGEIALHEVFDGAGVPVGLLLPDNGDDGGFDAGLVVNGGSE